MHLRVTVHWTTTAPPLAGFMKMCGFGISNVLQFQQVRMSKGVETQRQSAMTRSRKDENFQEKGSTIGCWSRCGE